MPTAIPPRRLLVIANPISGGGKSRSLVPQLCQELAKRGIKAVGYFTERAGDAADRARRAWQEPWDGLVACGGDGTINEVLCGMPDPSRPLGILPVGTANVLAKELGLPHSPHQLAELLQRGTQRSLPIGCANGRRFLLFCGAGLDGAVVQRLTTVRTGTLGKHKWLGPILHTAWHWPQFDLRVTFAEGDNLTGLSSVLVTLVRNYGGVLHLPREIHAGGDALVVLCFRQRSRAAWAWQGLRGMLGLMRPSNQLLLRHTRSLRIEGMAPVQVDGDHAGMSPINLELLPQRACIFAPGEKA